MSDALVHERPQSGWQRSRAGVAHFLTLPGVGPLLALLIAMLFFATQTDKFFTGRNFSLVVQQVIVVGTLAIGQTLIILTAGIDLSNGMVMALGSVIMASLAVEFGVPPVFAILIGLAITTAFGILNGSLVALVKLPPFIVTLGTLNIAYAITRIYRTTTISNLPTTITFLGNTFTLGETAITYGSVVMLVIYLIAWFILRETSWGRHVYAVGDNPEATRLAGISTTRLLISVYGAAGFIYGIAGLLLIARTQVGDPQAGQTANLDSITAVVLGGTSLFGGRGNVLGTLIGALIVGVFRNGLQLMGIPSMYQVLVTGILVILAVSVDQFSHRGQA
ncbi:MAG: ABC transporter permease [Caldilineaceae bacterium]|nr:ABC transporter permease [Caldilineaceae bacterium]